MSSPPTQAAAPPPSTQTSDPAVFKVLNDGTVLYKTYEQAAKAAGQLKGPGRQDVLAGKLSQAKLGEKYLAKDGQIAPYTIGGLVEFQLTGLIVVMVVLTGLSMICAAVGRLIKAVERPAPEVVRDAFAPSLDVPGEGASGAHPGMTDQQLVVLLTAAASEVEGGAVRIEKFRPLTAKDWNWSAQGRSALHAHRLK